MKAMSKFNAESQVWESLLRLLSVQKVPQLSWGRRDPLSSLRVSRRSPRQRITSDSSLIRDFASTHICSSRQHCLLNSFNHSRRGTNTQHDNHTITDLHHEHHNMATPLRNVADAVKHTAQSVVEKVASLTIGNHSAHNGDVEQSPVKTDEANSTTVSANATDKTETPEMIPETVKGKENVEPAQEPFEELEYSNQLAGEKHFKPSTSDATTDVPTQRLSQLPSSQETQAAQSLLQLSSSEEIQAAQSLLQLSSSGATEPAQSQHPTIHQLPGLLNGEELHPKTDEIVRQVEWYFSDDNLIGDAHLLARTGPTGDGWVSLNEILGFKKMRQFKPKLKVKASVATSELLEVQGKFIRRKAPLTKQIRVKPQISAKRERDTILVEKPWMTKGMLQPSGFEEYATEGPLTPAEFTLERRLFDPEEAFTTRIEYAANRFMNRKKMHQASANIFSKFMFFGGFAANTHMFTGGISKKELEEYDQDQILQMTAKIGVAESVVDGLDEYSMAPGSWVVDFEGMAKAFFSSEFLQRFDWSDAKVVHETTNVIRKFYEYLLYHDACPEYEDDIRDALDVLDLANEEIPKLANVSVEMPGSFNTAGSILHGGYQAQIRPYDTTADWVNQSDPVGLSDKDAWTILASGILAHGTDEQVDDIHQAHDEKTVPKVITEEDIGLEIVRIEPMSAEARSIYENDRIKGTFIKPTGKLHCKRWSHPGAAPRDLPAAVMAEEKRQKGKKYEFVVEEHILKNCVVGMKMEANVSQLENGFTWLDVVTNVYPSFFTWTLNERMRDWKQPGPPKSWMQRVSGKGEAEGQETGEGGDDLDED